MIKALSPLGATHRISVILDYADSVTATVLLSPKGEKEGQPLTFQIAGPVDELDTGFAAQLTEAVAKVTTATTDLASLDAQLAAAKKAKEEELAAARKPTAKPAAAAAKPSKSKPAKKDEDGEDDETPEAPAPATPTATSTAGAPSPAWKQKQALTPAPTPAAPTAQQPIELGDI